MLKFNSSLLKSPRSANHGFSLLEVLITIAVLSGGLVVVLQAIAFSAKNASLSVETADAVLWAQDRLALAEFYENRGLLPKIDTVAQKKGLYESAMFLTEDPEAATGELKISRLELNVVWKSRSQPREVRFQTSLRQFEAGKS